jgi:hypothetical protein
MTEILGAAGVLISSMFAIIIGLLQSIWKQNEKQMETIEKRLTECRARDDNSHSSFHVSIDKLRDSVNSTKERIAALEAREL